MSLTAFGPSSSNSTIANRLGSVRAVNVSIKDGSLTCLAANVDPACAGVTAPGAPHSAQTQTLV